MCTLPLLAGAKQGERGTAVNERRADDGGLSVLTVIAGEMTHSRSAALERADRGRPRHERAALYGVIGGRDAHADLRLSGTQRLTRLLGLDQTRC